MDDHSPPDKAIDPAQIGQEGDPIEEGKRLIRLSGDKGLSLGDRIAHHFTRLTWRTPLHRFRLKGRCEALAAKAVETFGSLDIWVNNAGIGYIMKPLLETTSSEWEAVIGVNLSGAFYGTKAAAKAMIAVGKGGRIINIASQAAKSGFPHMAPYTSSKHGMVGLTRSNAIELGAYGITVNAVCPNHVTTGLGAKQNEYFSKLLGFDTVEAYIADMKRKNPMGRPGMGSDTAAACAWLASDDAVYVTGEALNVSGGEEMH